MANCFCGRSLDQYARSTEDEVCTRFHAVEGLTSTAAELNILDGVPASITLTHAAGGANIVNLTFTVKDAAGSAVAKPAFFDFWLSDAATGLAVTSHAADTIAMSTGSVWYVQTAAKAIRVQTSASGVAVIVVTDTHKTAYYACAALPIDPRPNLIHLLATGDYGA